MTAALEVLRIGELKGSLARPPALVLVPASGGHPGAARQDRTSDEVLTGLGRDLLGFPVRRFGGRPVPETRGRIGHDVQRMHQHAERTGRTRMIDEVRALVQGTLELTRGQPTASGR